MAKDLEIERTFSQKVLAAVGIVVAAALLLLLVYFTIDVIMLLFSAALFAVFLRGFAVPLSRYIRIPEAAGVLLVFVLVLVVAAGGIAMLAPSVAKQVQVLRVELPLSAQKAAAFISQYDWGRTLIDQMPSTQGIIEKVDVSSLLSGVGGVFSSTVGIVGNLFIGILIAVYIAVEPKVYINGFVRLFSIHKRKRASEVLDAVGETLRWWLIGKAGSMLFIGVLTWIGLSILGVPLALTLGLIAALLSFIPNFGPILSVLPALLVAFVDTPIKAAYVAGLYLGIQLIESYLVTPYIERETVSLPPALTMVFQLALVVTLGFAGMVLAAPLLAVILVIAHMVYVQDVLGDKEGSELIPADVLDPDIEENPTE
ncbi:MAG TPA: AI-2E family transporter [Pyrinomonadaceae bacterium]|nr:AI-2E family transporter [Pyrinomonadaceae bacterium]HMP63970.1 AI-2E family transporter [Pyrinomonadaceae bacterium]